TDVADEDGAKTVEAIEETVVAVSSSIPEEPKVVEASSLEQQQPEEVNDLKNSPGPTKWELRQATKQALQLLQDNYPEFVA
ncbi:patellin-3-like, partial [Trifolium medium]|nr:patellin-3-like [Trifolium medium]